MHIDVKRKIGMGAVALGLLASVPTVGPGSAYASGSPNTNPAWQSYGNCNSWIPHGWSQTWWSNFSSTDWGSVNAVIEWYDSSAGGYVIVGSGQSGQVYGSTNTATVDLYWGVTARGSWEEAADHDGSMDPLTSTHYSNTYMWCG